MQTSVARKKLIDFIFLPEMASRTVENLVSHILKGCDLDDYDFYIYNNSFFVPVQVDIDDDVNPTECLLHICTKGVDPRTDRFQQPYAVYTIPGLFANAN